MEVNSVATSNAAAQALATAASDKSVVNSDFDTFLKMMTAQIKNQDPLEPMSSDDFSAQLATFSGVEQQVKTNELLAALGAQMGVMGMSQYASWIGLEARAAVPAQFDGSPISISPNPAAGADGAVLVVLDGDGNEVQRQAFTPSTDDIEWAGVDDTGAPFEPGLYSFDIESYSGEDLLSVSHAEIYTEIMEAKSQNGATVLVLEGGSEINADEVSALRNGA